MSLSDIFVQLNQLGFKVEFLGDVRDKYATLKINGYYIENRIVARGFMITGKGKSLSVLEGEDVVGFFKHKFYKEC